MPVRNPIPSLLPILGHHFSVLLFGIISVKLISRFVPPAVYGEYAIFLTLTQIGSLLTHAGLYNVAQRYWQREKEGAGTYALFLWGAFWRKIHQLWLAMIPITLVLAFAEGGFKWAWLFPFLVLANVTVAFGSMAQGILYASEQRWTAFGLGVVSGAARALLPVSLVLLLAPSVEVLAAGFAMHGLVLFMTALWIFRWAWNDAPPAADKARSWRQELRNYGQPYLLMGGGTWLLQNADRWVTISFFGAEEAGNFALASNLGAIIPGLAVTAMLQLVFPGIFREADRANSPADWQRLGRQADRLTLIFLVISVLGLLMLAYCGPFLVGWLVDERYRAAMGLLLPTGMAAVSVQVNQFHYLLLQGQQNSAGMVKVMMSVAGLKTLGSVIAAPFGWEYFLSWLIVSAVICALLGRAMIRSIALNGTGSRSDPT